MNKKMADKIISIAVPMAIRERFDYLCKNNVPTPRPGTRIRVPFGKNYLIGIVLGKHTNTNIPIGKLKYISSIIDNKPVISKDLLDILKWCSEYYHHPIGDVIKHALPSHIRRGGKAEIVPKIGWKITNLGKKSIHKIKKNAHKQIETLNACMHNNIVTSKIIKDNNLTNASINALYKKNYITKEIILDEIKHNLNKINRPNLTSDQKKVIKSIISTKENYKAFLLKGVTGSGKTEVYLRLIEEEIKNDRQSLLLVPEIGLTPQLVSRLKDRFGKVLSIMHSGLTEKERYNSWLDSYLSKSKVIVGTRSAIFAPLPKLGLIIVDEEHDQSYKQQDGFRYSARDIAIYRAKTTNTKVLLASATPSFESLHNSNIGKYSLLNMPKRVGKAGKPKIKVIDQNKHASNNIISTPLILAIKKHINNKNQVLLFLNRRGYAPVLFCKECKKTEGCTRCDSNMTIHKKNQLVICHHCGEYKKLSITCNYCKSNRVSLGSGTQRVVEDLSLIFPETQITRLDKDSTSKKGSLVKILETIESGYSQIIVGTQMLTKGHDFPNLTMVGILNTDQGILGTDFRSSEKLAQTLIQVAGRAGRRSTPGEVLIQTHFPNHPLISSLISDNYESFEKESLIARKNSNWPPYSHIITLRAKSVNKRKLFIFLKTVATLSKMKKLKVNILGPAPAIIEKKFNKFHAQLLFQSKNRKLLHMLVREVVLEIGKLRKNSQIYWNLDVDPIEL